MVHGAAKSRTRLNIHTHTNPLNPVLRTSLFCTGVGAGELTLLSCKEATTGPRCLTFSTQSKIVITELSFIEHFKMPGTMLRAFCVLSHLTPALFPLFR